MLVNLPPLPQDQLYKPLRRGKTLSPCTAMRNIGVPKNTGNPYYQQTDKESNPHGYNSLGTKYIDYGLGVALFS